MQCFTRCFTHRYGTYRLKKASDRNIHYQLEHMQAKYDASSIDIHQQVETIDDEVQKRYFAKKYFTS